MTPIPRSATTRTVLATRFYGQSISLFIVLYVIFLLIVSKHLFVYLFFHLLVKVIIYFVPLSNTSQTLKRWSLHGRVSALN